MIHVCGRCDSRVTASAASGLECTACGAALERDPVLPVVLGVLIALVAPLLVFRDALEAWGLPAFAVLALQAALILAMAAAVRAFRRLHPVDATPGR